MTEALHNQIHAELKGREAELIDLHRRIVQVPSINRGDGTSAHEDQVAAIAAEYLRGAGVRVEIHESEPERANLLAAFGGGGAAGESESGSGRRMLWMSHSDVVPPGDEAAWTHPPFSATLAEGRIWGRGSNDDKMLVAAELFAMACLARLGLPKRGELRVAVGADEEVGGALGFGWLAQHHADFLTCDLAVCEGGGESLGRFRDGLPAIALGTGEKGRYEVTFRASGDGGHACVPWGAKNPLATIQEIFRRVTAWRSEARPASPIFPLVGEWAGLANGGVTTANLEKAINQLAARSAALGDSLRGQSRMTLTPTMISGGDKSNAIPTEARLVCDSRLLPGQTRVDLDAVIAPIVAGLERVEVHVHTTTDPSVSPFNDEIHSLFQTACERALGTPVQIAPIWCVGATDARFVRSVGTPVYGFQLVHPDANADRLQIHCIDESIEVGMLLPCALSLAHLAVGFLEP